MGKLLQNAIWDFANNKQNEEIFDKHTSIGLIDQNEVIVGEKVLVIGAGKIQESLLSNNFPSSFDSNKIKWGESQIAESNIILNRPKDLVFAVKGFFSDSNIGIHNLEGDEGRVSEGDSGECKWKNYWASYVEL